VSDELLYRYDAGPLIELWRSPRPDGGWMHRLELQGRRPGVVVIAHDGDHVLLQQQWRAAVGAAVWQFPRGFGESGGAIDDGRRELEEETGATSGAGRVLGRILVDPGILSSSVDVVELAVPGLTELAFVSTDPAERIEQYRVVAPDELEQLVRDGELVDGITLAAIAVRRAALPTVTPD
jgi:8-oxo-dGTP pyrophosphatase MutT (NUDIX family)